MLKSRRAEHLIAGIVRSVRLKIERSLPLPSSVIFFNFHLHVLSPLLLVAILLTTAVACVVDFRMLLFLAVPLIALLAEKSRVFVISYLTSNIALTVGLFRYLTGKRSAVWRKVDEMRLKG